MTPPSTAKRTDADARRQHIVDAASACVRRSGFHGASMSEIANTAGLSVGQIYRYFENKEAIIEAIVARDTAEMRDIFGELIGAKGPLLDAILDKCCAAVDDAHDRDRTALTLEVVAEAARNPAVARIVQAADTEQRPLKLEIIARTAPSDCSDAELRARSEVISMLFDGMIVAAVKHPHVDRDCVAEVMRGVLTHLFAGPSMSKNSASET